MSALRQRFWSSSSGTSVEVSKKAPVPEEMIAGKVTIDHKNDENMKRFLYLVSLALIATLSSCSIKEEALPEVKEPHFRGVMEKTVPATDTRAYADDAFHVYWNNDDRVSIFYDKTYNRQYKFTGRTGTTAGDFERVGSDPDHFTEVTIESGYNYAIYPYHRYNACDYDGTLTIAFPTERTFDESARGIGASIALVSRAEDGDFMFKHAAGYVGFKLYGEGVSVASVTLKSNNNEPLSGYPYVVYTDDDVPFLTFDDNSDGVNQTTIVCDPPVQLSASSSDYKIFWFTVPPTVFTKGFTFTVTDVNGGTFSKARNSSYVVERKVFRTMSPIQVIPEGGETPGDVHVTGVQVAPTSATLEVGDNTNLTATVLPSNATDKTVTWSSSNTSVATVDANGKVTAVAAGETVITVTTTDGGKTATCTVTVNTPVISVESVQLDASAEADILIGGTQTYVVTLTTTTNGESAESVVANAVLTLSDTAKATVEGLVVTGVAEGKVTVTAKFTPEGSAEELTAAAQLTINKEPNQPGDPIVIEDDENL